MRFSIFIPHFKTGKMTAYCIHKLLQHKGKHDIDIIVMSNSGNDGLEYFQHMIPSENIYIYPENLTQSHGLAYDRILTHVSNVSDYFITVESDSFPTQDNWLDTYEQLINEGYDMAGSRLRLSGGEYIHPAGAMYKKSNWMDAKELVDEIHQNYCYYPNLGMKDGFPCHIMSKYRLSDFPDKHHSYNNISFDKQLESYEPIAQSVFHNGQGFRQESYTTYGQRNIEGERPFIIPSIPAPDTIYRMGYEPGQWFAYWHYATNKRVFQIGTEIVWMPNRENQQQERTIMYNGFTHLWAVTAYHDCTDPAVADIAKRKAQLMEELYNSIK